MNGHCDSGAHGGDVLSVLLQLNDNKLETVEKIRCLQHLSALDTLYLERNPLQASLGPGYRQAVTDLLPRKFLQCQEWLPLAVPPLGE